MANKPFQGHDKKTRIRFDSWEVVGTEPGGGDKFGWVGKFYRWAEIRKSDGSESAIAQRMQSVVPARIFVRYDSDTRTITSAWRAVELESVPSTDDEDQSIAYNDIRFWALKTAEDIDGDRQFITMQAVSGVADA